MSMTKRQLEEKRKSHMLLQSQCCDKLLQGSVTMHAIAESAKQPKVKKVKAQRLSGPANVHEGMKKEPVRQSARNRGKPAPVYNEIDSERGAKGHKGKGDGFAGAIVPQWASVRELNSLGECVVKYGDEPLGRRLPMMQELKKGTNKGFGKYVKTYNGQDSKTCHWCRQKCDSPKVTCLSCKAKASRDAKASGAREKAASNWCGPCLETRHLENINEILADHSNWLCPLCREICNCSGAKCQRAQAGLHKTGAVLHEGYGSAAHRLVLGSFNSPSAMCYGFDGVIQGLHVALEGCKSDAVERLDCLADLQDLVSGSRKMGLEDRVKDRTFRHVGIDRPAEDVDGLKLFYYRCSAAEVIAQLKQLISDAEQVLRDSKMDVEPGNSTDAEKDV